MYRNYYRAPETYFTDVVILPKTCSVSLLNNAAIPNIVRGFLIEIPWVMEIALHNYGLKLFKVL